ncbi:MAG TPA: class I adenylate-forming enzyme family protein [Pseudonocardiaceae bacterium]|nr:class I adenylate-forming enzyme family protein [Pseudonocardiaceae bacterium]
MTKRSLIFDQLWAASADRPPWIFDRGSDAVEVKDGQVRLRKIAIAAGKAATLFEAQGTRPGDRCVVWLDTPLDIMIAAVALTAIGAVPVLISPALGIDMLTQMLAPVPPVDRVITTAARLPSSAALTVRVRTDDWASLVAEASHLEPRRVSLSLPPTAPYVITHTSGTTGVNKLVMYSRESTDHNSLTQEIPAKLQRLRGYAAISFSPVHFRFIVGLLAALRRKVPAIILADEDPVSVGKILRRWQPSYLEAHPNTFMKWEPLGPAGALASVKCFLATFDVIHRGTVKNLLAGSRYPFALFWEIYGQSELCSVSGVLHVRGFVERNWWRGVERRLSGHLVGWGVPGHSRIRIVDADGATVSSGVAGRIQVRAKGSFTTYVNRPEAVGANLTADGWWDTGDWGKMDRLGRVSLLDRQVERLTAAPSAIALEDVLLDRMPWLLEAVVLERDNELVPVVATRGGPLNVVRWRAATRDLPFASRQPVVFDECDIPRTATGKVQRAVLAERVAAVRDGLAAVPVAVAVEQAEELQP